MTKANTPCDRRRAVELVAKDTWQKLDLVRTLADGNHARLSWTVLAGIWPAALNVVYVRQTAKKTSDPRSTRIIRSLKSTQTLPEELIEKMERVDQWIVMDSRRRNAP